jgi:hypothetical protein
MKNFCFMAFGKAKELGDASESFKRWIGTAPCKVLAVNPTKEERNKLINAEIESEPTYTGTSTNGKPQVRVTFYVQPEVEGAPIIPVSFFIEEDYRFNRDQTKIQVIDKYGYSSWATKEQLKDKAVLLSAKGKKLRITQEYRPAYKGEADLMEFIKNYLGIDELLAYINEEWQVNKDRIAADCECSIDMTKLLKGDFKEIKTIPTLCPNAKVVIMFGVKTSDDGKQQQAAYTSKTCKSNARNYIEIEKDLQARKAAGGLKTTEYDTKPLREYEVKPTEFTEEKTPEQDPFAVDSSDPFFA